MDNAAPAPTVELFQPRRLNARIAARATLLLGLGMLCEVVAQEILRFRPHFIYDWFEFETWITVRGLAAISSDAFVAIGVALIGASIAISPGSSPWPRRLFVGSALFATSCSIAYNIHFLPFTSGKLFPSSVLRWAIIVVITSNFLLAASAIVFAACVTRGLPVRFLKASGLLTLGAFTMLHGWWTFMVISSPIERAFGVTLFPLDARRFLNKTSYAVALYIDLALLIFFVLLAIHLYRIARRKSHASA